MLSDRFVFGKIGRKEQYVIGIAFFVLILLLWLVVPLSVLTKEERKTVQPMPEYKAVEVEGHNFYIRDAAWFVCKMKNCIAGKRKGKLFAIVPLDVTVKIAPRRREEKTDWADSVVIFPWWSFAVWWVPEFVPKVSNL